MSSNAENPPLMLTAESPIRANIYAAQFHIEMDGTPENSRQMHDELFKTGQNLGRI
jgi:hypothetical protein